jgi:hypothetical protein
MIVRIGQAFLGGQTVGRRITAAGVSEMGRGMSARVREAGFFANQPQLVKTKSRAVSSKF